VAAHGEADEGGQDGMAVRSIGEHHQHEEAQKDELDLRLDHAIAVASEEPRRDPR
jgi:hypothetical protein